ncbi:MAG TPA: hypothetical protein V6C72_11545 [Chroococcales cyanobacterium]
MADNDDNQDGAAQQPPPQAGQPLPLVDELGIIDLDEPIVGGRGRLFSAAGRQSPVAEFNSGFLILHPPQNPFEEEGEVEDIRYNTNERGILLDEFNNPKKIPGAKYKGNELWWLGKQSPGTTKHYAGWFDEDDVAHLLYFSGQPLTTDLIFRLRNKTHDGEISIFPDLDSDDKE